MHFLSLAISVGTPVVTLQSGTVLMTPRLDLKEIRMYLMYNKINLRSNPMSHYISHFEIPWNPSISYIHGFYKRIGLDKYFVAENTSTYVEIASQLALNR